MPNRLSSLKCRAFIGRGGGQPSRLAGAAICCRAAERGVDPGELVEPFLDFELLLLQKLDLLQAFLTAQTQRLGVSIAAFLGRDHLADLTEREAELLALEDQREPRPVALRIEPAQAFAMRRDQPFVLVEAQCAQRHPELT